MDKHFVYHQLFECLGQDLCPICALITRNIDKFIDGFLYESVNDIKLRENIKKSRGYCNYHAWRLQKAGDPLAHAIIYGDLLEQEVRSMEDYLKQGANRKSLLSGQPAGSNAVRRLKDNFCAEGKCPLCNMVEESEMTYIKSFAEYMIHDAEFRNRFEEKSFLCIPHMKKLTEYCSDFLTIKEIMRMQLEKIRKLSADLNEIKRKADYRYSSEPMSDDEKTAWIKAVRHWVGEPGF